MLRATITQEQVDAMADQLQAAGIPPSARAVRDALGGGRIAAIGRLLHVWKGKTLRQATSTDIIPPALQDALVDGIRQEIALAVEALGDARFGIRDRSSNTTGLAGRQAALIEDLENQVERLRAEKAELLGRSTQMGVELERVRKHLDAERQATESALTELARLRLQLEAVPELEGQIHRLHQALEAQHNARAASEQSAAIAAAKLEVTEAQVADLQSRLAKAEQDLPQMRAASAPGMSAFAHGSSPVSPV